MKNILKTIIVALLSLQARAVLLRRKPKVAVITGSVGKTSTKDALAIVLARSFRVRKSEKSFNSDIGVPLTILGLKNAWGDVFGWIFNLFLGAFEIIRPGRYPKWLVLEVGADKPGDLEELFKWLPADLCVVTRFPDVPVHVEFYDSPEALVKEESIPALKVKESGFLVLNADDSRVRALRDKSRARILTYGFDSKATVVGKNLSIRYEESDGHRAILGLSLKIESGNESLNIDINGALGAQHAYPLLAAVATGQALGMSLKDALETLRSLKTPPGRMRILEGERGSTLIDDTYNSSPVAVTEALKTLKEITGLGRKIAVLGDMLELGVYSDEAHKKAGEEARGSADILITVGLRARGIALGAEEVGLDKAKIFSFDNSIDALDFVQKMIRDKDVILIKGSQSIRMERIVEKLMLRYEERGKLLVRQEKEWKRR